MDNEFKLPDYYNITKPKSEEKLIKRKWSLDGDRMCKTGGIF